MKTHHLTWKAYWICGLALAVAGKFNDSKALAGTSPAVVITSASGITQSGSGNKNGSEDLKVRIESIEPENAGSKGKEVSWLGVATEECTEALSSQLGLGTGEGLLVTYVAPDSPAQKAGLKKNDVLAEFEGQLLVHPAQFRKLIHMRKEGDSVKLSLYRGGKKETVEATLGKTSSLALERLPDIHFWTGGAVNGWPMGEAMREQMKSLHQTLSQAGVDKEVNSELKRSVEEVRKAIQEAMRQATNAARTFGPAAREFQELARRGLDVDKDATVVVKSKRSNTVKSIVKTDDSGTYVIIATPKKQLTAHDKSGKLLFDGSIETSKEQEKVPKDVWEKVKPMIEQLSDEKAEQEDVEEQEDNT